MKYLAFMILASLSEIALADEFCAKHFGKKDYFVQSKAGGLLEADGTKFQLALWKDNKIILVPDATFTILESTIFSEEILPWQNEDGNEWIYHIADFAVRMTINTNHTDLGSSNSGEESTKQITLTTTCTSIREIALPTFP